MKLVRTQFNPVESLMLHDIASLFRHKEEHILNDWRRYTESAADLETITILEHEMRIIVSSLTKHLSIGDIRKFEDFIASHGDSLVMKGVPYDSFLNSFFNLSQSFMNTLRDFGADNKYAWVLNKLHQHSVQRYVHRYMKEKDNTLVAIVALTELRDKETAMHLERTSVYSKAIASWCGYCNEEAEHIANAGKLHDLGKVAIPDSILLKNGKLTEQEFEVMKTHPKIGALKIKELISNYGSIRKELETAYLIALYHHESEDGKGYYGVGGDNIPFEAKIFMICDVYDALVNDRPYRKALSHDEALGIIAEEMQKQFHPKILSIFKNKQYEINSIRIQFKS